MYSGRPRCSDGRTSRSKSTQHDTTRRKHAQVGALIYSHLGDWIPFWWVPAGTPRNTRAQNDGKAVGGAQHSAPRCTSQHVTTECCREHWSSKCPTLPGCKVFPHGRDVNNRVPQIAEATRSDFNSAQWRTFWILRSTVSNLWHLTYVGCLLSSECGRERGSGANHSSIALAGVFCGTACRCATSACNEGQSGAVDPFGSGVDRRNSCSSEGACDHGDGTSVNSGALLPECVVEQIGDAFVPHVVKRAMEEKSK